ncbi:hypothetical protein B0H19DRAFT_1247995 [Mycena capillaripes]|nr:hypothetical protein B0H19DRAFT_1247995 [Mycena capillaripes]
MALVAKDHIRDIPNEASLVGRAVHIVDRDKGVPTRPATQKKLDLVQEAMIESFEIYVSDEEIWKAACGKEILLRSAQFLALPAPLVLPVALPVTGLPEPVPEAGT